MRLTLDRHSFALRALGAGTLLSLSGLAGCGNSNLYQYDAPAAVVVADFNGSGYPAMAVAQAQINQLTTVEQPGYVALIEQNTSNLGSYEPSVHFATQGNPSAMAVGSFIPGTVDLAVANVNDDSISVLIENDTHPVNFKPAINVPASPAGLAATTLPFDVAICDVNNDGHPDIVVAYQLQQNISNVVTPVGGGVNVILQDPSNPGTFLAATNVGSAPTPMNVVDGLTVNGAYQYPNSSFGVACANLSGDSTAAPDIVMTSYSAYDDTLYANGGTLSIFFHDPAHPGSFLPRVDIPLPGALHRVVIADVNGDGLPDLIVADEEAGADGVGESGAMVLLQKKPSSPGAQPTFGDNAPNLTDSAISIAVGDLTGSGFNDIVVSSSAPSGTGSISVLLNTPSDPGTFATPVVYSGLGNPVAVAIGNLDGKVSTTLPDIATADTSGGAVMFNEASNPGTFEASVLVGG